MPPVGIAISLERKILLELCILTAILMDARSEPSGRSITNRVNVKEHSLKIKRKSIKVRYLRFKI